ncbi:MAG: iron-sulfur cluster assembly scaffold protein [Chloroflexi bacterium]|nr:iron-sulfur cluster assembly scaffold protein [Chloroflexota bacterium]
MNSSNKVLEHFFNPRNPGEVETPDGIGTSGGPEERNFMRITIKVDNDKITDIKFQSYTCVVAVAACSLVTELAKGKGLNEAMNLSSVLLATQLGGVPAERMDRCHLAIEALRNACQDFIIKKENRTMI